MNTYKEGRAVVTNSWQCQYCKGYVFPDQTHSCQYVWWLSPYANGYWMCAECGAYVRMGESHQCYGSDINPPPSPSIIISHCKVYVDNDPHSCKQYLSEEIGRLAKQIKSLSERIRRLEP